MDNTSTEPKDYIVVEDTEQDEFEHGKKWYKSKTVWVNALAILVLIIQTQIGFVISPEEQTAILAVINLILRWITGEPITA
ncbi:MAG: hypothetical protein ACXQTD_04280 [Candidatus Syntropharchaeia archaeon]